MRSQNLFFRNLIPSFSALLPLSVRLILFTPTLTGEKGERERQNEIEGGRESVREVRVRNDVRSCEGGRRGVQQWEQSGRMEQRTSGEREDGKTREWGQREHERTWGREVRSIWGFLGLVSYSQPLQKYNRHAAMMSLLPKAEPRTSPRTCFPRGCRGFQCVNGFLYSILFGDIVIWAKYSVRRRKYIFTPRKT